MRWQEFAKERPDLARAGRGLLYQYGVGLAFLATTSADGAPRVHPMCPLVTDADIFGFLVPSPKRRDLHRDGRYAMHSFPAEDDEDAFYVAGRAHAVAEAHTRKICARQYIAERHLADEPADLSTWDLFRFDIATCLLTRTAGHGDSSPNHTVWVAAR